MSVWECTWIYRHWKLCFSFLVSAQDHHTRCNTHGYQFLEKQLTGIRNTDLGNLERKIRTLCLLKSEKESMGKLNTVLNIQLLHGIIKYVQVNLYYSHISLYQLDGNKKIIIKINLQVSCIKCSVEHINIKYFLALFVCVCYLCLVFAASAFKCLVEEVGYGNETTEITHDDSIWVRGLKQPLPQELGNSVGNLTISLHLTKS